MKVLSARNLEKVYKGRKVVRDVSLEVKSGEIVGLLGPNGAGKTTSFYMIIGLVKPNKGQVMIDNQDITQLPMHERARKGLGYLPQETSIFRMLTVKENILGILQTRKDLTRSQRMQKLEELLDDFHIGHLVDNSGISLSGGERRRVEIARALTTDPAFILLDEPFAGVDPISVSDIKHIISTLAERNIGVLITDHNVRETLDICGKAFIVSEGKILAQGTPDEVLTNQSVKEVYLGHQFRL